MNLSELPQNPTYKQKCIEFLIYLFVYEKNTVMQL